MDLYLDIVGGISGDMFMAALLGLGADWERFQKIMQTLVIHEEFDINLETARKGSIAGLQAKVVVKGSPKHHDHRHVEDIFHIIDTSGISQRAKQLSKTAFTRLGEAEAEIHGLTLDQVHFHEVGAVDSIVDIIGVCVLIDMLNIRKVYYNTLPMGGGWAKMAHGSMPLPAPATLKLMEGMKVRISSERGERVTPTGAALLAALKAESMDSASIRIVKTSISCGQRDFERPNILRGILFESEMQSEERERLFLVETNIDDMTGELIAEAAETLRKGGARDVWIVPILMKKGRPAYTLSALTDESFRSGIERLFFEVTTTLGVRVIPLQRKALRRTISKYKIGYGEIKVKTAYLTDGRTKRKAEFEDLKRLSESAEISVLKLKNTMQSALDREVDDGKR